MYESNKYMGYLNNTVCTKFTSADAKKVSSVLCSARLEATNSVPNSTNLYHNKNKAIFPLLCYPSYFQLLVSTVAANHIPIIVKYS